MSGLMKGVLRSWDEGQGFGYILPEQGSSKIELHFDYLLPSARSPQIGDVIWYQLKIDKQGKKIAIKAEIEGVEVLQSARFFSGRQKTQLLLLAKWMFAMAMVLGIVWNGFFKSSNVPVSTISVSHEDKSPQDLPSKDIDISPSHFICDAKAYCSGLLSKEQGEYYLRHCLSLTTESNPCLHSGAF